MTPETNALIPVGIAALCFLLAFLYGRHRRALALRRRVAESFGQTPAEPERPRAMTREFWELLRAGEPAGLCIDDATWNDLDMDDVSLFAVVARVEREAKVQLPDAQVEAWVSLGDLLDAVSQAACHD